MARTKQPLPRKLDVEMLANAAYLKRNTKKAKLVEGDTNKSPPRPMPSQAVLVSPDGKQKVLVKVRNEETRNNINGINDDDNRKPPAAENFIHVDAMNPIQLKPIKDDIPMNESATQPPVATTTASCNGQLPDIDDDVSSVNSEDSAFFKVLRQITKNGAIDLQASPPSKKNNNGVHCEVHVEHLSGNLMLVTCRNSSNGRDPFIRQGTKAVEQGKGPFDKYCCFPVILSEGPNTDEAKKTTKGYNFEGMVLFKGLTKKDSEKNAAKFVMDYKIFLEEHGYSIQKGLHKVPEGERWSFYDLKDEELGLAFDDTPTNAEGGKRKLGDVVVEANAVDICLKIADILHKNTKEIRGQRQFTSNYFNPPYGRITKQRLGLGIE